jgi:hypothetical protein
MFRAWRVIGLVAVAVLGATCSSTERSRTSTTTAPSHPQRTPTTSTVPGRKPRIQRVLVVGNSIALYAGDEGFKRLHTTPRLDVLNLGSIGCRLLPEETRSRFPSGDIYEGQARVCRDNWAFAVSVFRPDVVVMLFSDPTGAAHEVNGRWTAPCESGYDTVFEGELHEQIRLLASKGARVIVTTTAYAGLPFKSLAWYHHNDCQNAIFRRVAASEPRAVMADIFKWMCPRLDANCDTHISHVVLRPDGVHFRDASARMLAAWLIAQSRPHGAFSGVRVDGPEAHDVAIRPAP